MGRQRMTAASQRLERRQFAEVEAGIHHQSHTHLYTVGAEVQFFEPPHVAQLEVEGVVVVAQRVLIGKERLTGILRTCQTELDAVLVVELVAHVVTVFVA